MSLATSHMEQKKDRTIVFFPCPFQGHLKPMMQLASVLYATGFSVVVVHPTFKFPDASMYPHFTFHELPDSLNESDLGQCSTEDMVALFQKLNTNCVNPLKECLANLLAAGTEAPVACLISDSVWSFSQAVADEFGLPRLCLRTTSICALLALTALPTLMKKGYFPLRGGEEEEEASVEELPPLRVKDLPLIQSTRFDSTFHQLAKSAIVQSNVSAGLILNSDEELERTDLQKLSENNPIPVYTIGPSLRRFSSSSHSMLPQDKTCMKWLDKQRINSVLYVSFGSIASVSAADFSEIAAALSRSRCPFIWVIRPGLVIGADCHRLLPTSFGEEVRDRGCVVEWAPQQEILAHPATGGFWTHNGWNSTFESMSEGVPMICSPNFGDQKVSARYVSDVWKVGIHLEGKLEREAAEDAIRRMMEEDEGDELRENAAVLKKKLEMSRLPGGCSFLHLQRLITTILSLP